jgi:hypothetical protein
LYIVCLDDAGACKVTAKRLRRNAVPLHYQTESGHSYGVDLTLITAINRGAIVRLMSETGTRD